MVEKLEGVSLGGVGHMLRDWCEVKRAKMMVAEGRSKFEMVDVEQGVCR